MVLNQQHTVVPGLDIFSRVGKAAAHDEVVPFTVEGGQLTVGDESSDFDGNLNIEFSKVVPYVSLPVSILLLV